MKPESRQAVAHFLIAAGRELNAFLEGLEAQVFLSPVELYGYWLQHRQAITDGYQALEAKVPLQRGLYLLFRNLARGFRRLRKGKRGR